MDINNEAQAGQQAARHIYCLCSLSKDSLEISFFPSSSLPLSLSPLICFLTPLLFFRLLMTFQCTSTLSSHFFYLLFYCLLPPISYPLSVLFLFSLSLCLHSISSFCSLCSIFLSCTSWSIKSSCSENMDVNIILKVGKRQITSIQTLKKKLKDWAQLTRFYWSQDRVMLGSQTTREEEKKRIRKKENEMRMAVRKWRQASSQTLARASLRLS